MTPILALYRTLDARRRRQFALAMLLMLLGAVAELLTIGAVLPFLALIAAPGGTSGFGAFTRWLTGFGGDPVLLASLIICAAAVATAVLRTLLIWYIQRFVAAVGHDLAAAIFARMLRQPYAVYVRRSSGEIIAALEKVHSVVADILQPGLQGVTSAFIALAIMALLIAIAPLSAMAAVAVVLLVYLGISLAARGRSRRNSKTLSEAWVTRINVVQAGLGGIRDVLLDRSQPLFEQSFRRADLACRRAHASNNFIAASPRFAIEAAGIALLALIAWLMSRQPGGVVAAIPVLGALALGAQRLLPLLHQAWAGFSLSAGALRPLDDILTLLAAPIVDDAPGTAADLPFAQSIRFEDVSYRHPEGRFGLEAVSFAIPKGARVGIVGPTGSGKSTLLDLLMGLLEPESGRVTIDGRPLDRTTRAAWQARLAHVPQSIYLADDSIAANIAFGVPPAAIDQARLEAVAAAAQLDRFVAELEEGFETRIGERGIRLSGGQRQRLGIARALYRGASVLILDEATSALDDAVEAAVMRAIMALSAEITIVMIAHRGSTLEGCDRLIRLAEGRIVAA
ncbi:MAG TPA: ABC transporter ATP-binding protein [Allosphingosinicella sp.]|nr:ABC transporter ATP-binding protein [Allosphingosinicella sp.]